jgi:EmrB/QacA subfamily drug resistance transporter
VNATKTLLPRRTGSSNALLFVVCLAQFMVILDVAVVNVALPEMRTGLHFSTTGLQWVLNAYTITFAGFMMLGARVADLLGRRTVFIAGTALFAVSSLACAIAGSPGMLIGVRALQGFAGGIVSPATLSIITSSLREGPERNRGLGLWGAIGGLGASSGALLGGVLTQAFGWPAIFAINVPLGALVIALTPRAIPADLRSTAPRHFDVAGAVLMTVGLLGLTYGIVRSDAIGWGSSGVIVPLALGLLMLVGFTFVEARLARSPLVPLSIFRLTQLRTANLVVVLMYAALFSMFFFITLYLQQVLGDNALQAGLSFLPITLSVFTGSSLAPRLVARLGVRPVVTLGMLCATGGLLLLTGVRPGGNYFAVVAPGGILSGLGMGLTLVSSTIAATQGVPRTQSGLASGLLNMSRLFGGALGLAILSTIAASSSRGVAGGAWAMTDGFTAAFEAGAAITILAALLAAVGLRPVAGDALPPDRVVLHDAVAVGELEAARQFSGEGPERLPVSGSDDQEVLVSLPLRLGLESQAIDGR